VRAKPGRSGNRAVAGIFSAGSLSKYGDVVLAAAVIAIVGAMILPMPTWLLDVLLSTNISVAVILLLLGIYMDQPVSFSSFPSLLLITTLFRLALNVSSTRLILSQAFAGEVIQAFGEFVVAGNYVVGGVVFLILTIVQFVVIAKGSERVAEVSARFALDGMPGKQMSIDADLRAGLIDGEMARDRRRKLERESQLYGAMDGAMKFVKGDAIAGILITTVNILAGLAIGITQKGMSAGEALKTYSLLTIGDGLVSQIPALLIATSAGMIVTRVAGEEEGSPLSRELGRQILSKPRAIAVASGLLLLIALVPGMPTTPFLLLSMFCGAAALMLSKKSRKASQQQGGMRLFPVNVPDFAVRISRVEHGLRKKDKTDPVIPVMDTVSKAMIGLASDLGFPLPVPEVISDPGMEAGRFKVELRGVPIGEGTMEGDAGEVARHILRLIMTHAKELLGIQEAKMILDSMRKESPDLVESVQKIDLFVLAGVFRLLVAEGLGLGDKKGLLEALASAPDQELHDASALAERVRAASSRRITWQVGGEQKEVSAVLLAPEVEDEIRSSVKTSPDGAFLALGPELGRQIVEEIGKIVGVKRKSGEKPVLLVSADTRRFVRALTENVLPDLPVVTYRELLPDTKLKPIATIGTARQQHVILFY